MLAVHKAGDAIAGYTMFEVAGIEHPVSGIEHQDGNRPILTFCDSFGH
jgi:hypothetical protein